MIRAVFIDGVGRRQYRAIDALVPEYLFPRAHVFKCLSVEAVPHRMPYRDHHRFRLLYSRGDFAVYGYLFDAEPQYRAFCTRAEWSRAIVSDRLREVLREQDRHIDRFSVTAHGPVYDIASFIRGRDVVSRECFYVARSMGVSASLGWTP